MIITDEMCFGLSERRKADRRKMALLLRMVAESEGATVKEQEPNRLLPNRVQLLITGARGMSVLLDFDGSPHGNRDVFVGCWNLPFQSKDHFQPWIFGSFDTPYYGNQKETVVGYGLRDLLTKIQRHLRAGADGSAFSEEIATEYERKKTAGLLPWQQIARAQAAGAGALLV